MKKKHLRIGIITQVALLFVLGILTTGIIAYFTQLAASDYSVRDG